MSDSDNSRKRALECMRLVADCMQLAGDVHSPSVLNQKFAVFYQALAGVL